MSTKHIEHRPTQLSRRRLCGSAVILTAAAAIGLPNGSWAATAAEIDADANNALDTLYKQNEGARTLADRAKGILIFPSIVKGGLIVGGAFGEGALRVGGKSIGYYNSVAGSIGLQVGVQSFSYALFFMTDEALNYVEKSDGWEVGVGPTVVVADEGFAASASSTTLQAEIYAFIFGQEGLMAGLSIEGSKITRIER